VQILHRFRRSLNPIKKSGAELKNAANPKKQKRPADALVDRLLICRV
jgi:hypothetical protein